MSDLLSIGLTGLNAAQTALSTTSNNISNASTPGYSREVAQLTPLPGQQTEYGYLGNGVTTTAVVRQTSSYLDAGVQTAQAVSSEQSSYYSAVSQLDQALASSTTDIGTSMTSWFSNLQAVSSDPSSVPNRQTALGSAQTLTDAITGVGAQISALGSQVNQQIQSDVGQINSYATQIAQLNQSIQRISQSDTSQQPNDLLDQRDALVQSLSKLVGTSVVAQGNGSENVFIGNGQALVVGNQPYALTTAPSTSDPSKLEIGYQSPKGTVQVPESEITGGDLGAQFQFRSQTLQPAAQQLGRLATSFALTMNQQNAAGSTLSGTQGGDLFTLAQPQVFGSSTNTGNASLKVGFVSPGQLQASDYKVSLDGNGYHISRSSDGSSGVDASSQPAPAAYTAAQLAQGVQVDGLSFTLSAGAMQPGDSFLVQPVEGTLTNLQLTATDPGALAAAAGPVGVTPAQGNTGTASMTMAGLAGVSSLANPITISFSNANTYSISGSSNADATGLTVPPNGQIAVDGVTVNLSGIPASGDSFALGNNTAPFAPGDGTNVNAMAATQTTKLMESGTATFTGLYSDVVSSVGTTAAQYQSTSTSAQGTLAAATAAQQSVSGVNLDEEAAHLIQFQQQYQANAKVIQIASTLFQSILQING